MSNNLIRAKRAAIAMHEGRGFARDLYWMEVAHICRDKAGNARTNRGMVRLVHMVRFAEIQAEIGIWDQAEADRAWAAYCRINH